MRSCTVRATVARYYDPTTAQFLTRDPLEDVTGQPYSYADDDPLDESDPSGLSVWGDIKSGVEDTAGVVTGYDAVKSFVGCTGSSSVYDCAVENFDPAYYAIDGYYNEWQAAENGCSLGTIAKYGAEGVVGLAGTVGVAVGGVETIDDLGYFNGREISIGDNFRVSPFGNRDAPEWYMRAPHYHRRILDPDGNTVPGGGIKWHRPWQKGF